MGRKDCVGMETNEISCWHWQNIKQKDVADLNKMLKFEKNIPSTVRAQAAHAAF